MMGNHPREPDISDHPEGEPRFDNHRFDAKLRADYGRSCIPRKPSQISTSSGTTRREMPEIGSDMMVLYSRFKKVVRLKKGGNTDHGRQRYVKPIFRLKPRSADAAESSGFAPRVY
jgi:hypothetical protein